MDIHNTLEVVDVMDALAADVKAAKADGVLNIWDSPKFANLITKGRKALDDSAQIVLELKDLDDTEIQTLVGRLMAAASSLLDALISPPAVKA